ncbi:MAG: tRNA-dihydrouridine synthase [Dissulfurimicrobium sp.]|uniref:tRNA-dihydrouridine synthase n=1 Tax=Dissulfurimicrobium sp. TaxID=2022436 RepID=UPI00404B0CD7
MRDETLAARVMEAVVNAVNIPVTIKIRLGWDHGFKTQKLWLESPKGLAYR